MQNAQATILQDIQYQPTLRLLKNSLPTNEKEISDYVDYLLTKDEQRGCDTATD